MSGQPNKRHQTPTHRPSAWVFLCALICAAACSPPPEPLPQSTCEAYVERLNQCFFDDARAPELLAKEKQTCEEDVAFFGDPMRSVVNCALLSECNDFRWCDGQQRELLSSSSRGAMQLREAQRIDEATASGDLENNALLMRCRRALAKDAVESAGEVGRACRDYLSETMTLIAERGQIRKSELFGRCQRALERPGETLIGLESACAAFTTSTDLHAIREVKASTAIEHPHTSPQFFGCYETLTGRAPHRDTSEPMREACRALIQAAHTALVTQTTAQRDDPARTLRTTSACLPLQRAAEVLDVAADAEKICAEIALSPRVHQGLREAQAYVEAGRPILPASCDVPTLDRLKAIDTPWAQTQLQRLLKRCYLDLGVSVLSDQSRTLRLGCGYWQRQVYQVWHDHKLAGKNSALDELIGLVKARDACRPPDLTPPAPAPESSK